MLTERKLICIVCPRGCQINVQMDGSEIKSIQGQTCKRGEEYARAECTAPRRTLTTTAKIRGAALPLLPVRSQTPVPKERLFDIMREINRVSISAPVKAGDIVLENACGTGVNIIASRDMPQKSE
jgi:CxxC motif-containing protein